MNLRRRFILTLLLFLLAGAIINVAVAWGCATWATEFGVDYGYLLLAQFLPDGTRINPPPSPIYYSAGWPLRAIVSRPWSAIEPRWPGFAINTIFYAAVLWVLFALGGVPGAVRRRLRRKRGQCASCGYSLRENVSDKCPECGASVKPHRSQPRLA